MILKVKDNNGNWVEVPALVGNGISSISKTSGTSLPGSTDTYTISYTNGTTSTFQVYNGQDGQGTGDMLMSMYDTDEDGIVDNAEKVNNHTVNADVPSNAKFTDTITHYIITEDIVTITTDSTKGVSPYNTSYGYTNIEIDENSGIEWKEGATYTFLIDTKMVISSTYRNTRVRIGSAGEWKPVYFGSAIAKASDYFTKAYNTMCIYKNTYQSDGALHILSDNNTTYSVMTSAELETGTSTSGRLISPSFLASVLGNSVTYYNSSDLNSDTNFDWTLGDTTEE